MPDNLDSCGCCEGVERLTPAPVANRPGLSALAYRVGTHARFKRSMQAALAEQPALRALTTRADDDPSIALLDAWATTLDVLTFYQERIANEGYLRTATERASVLHLARRIGYELRPGVAASTVLAFTLQTAPGAPASATVPVGTQAQSVPGQDEKPQTFETVDAIEARAAWQAMPARQRRPQPLGFGARRVVLDGVGHDLAPGDTLLFVGAERAADPGNENWDVRRVTAVALDRERGLTTAELERGLGSFVPFVRPAAAPRVYVFRTRAALFGHNAADWDAMPIEVRRRYGGDEDSPADWPGLTISGVNDGDDPEGTVYLDALYPRIVPESWVVLARPGYAEVYRVEAVAEDARSGFTLSAKTTRLTLDGEDLGLRFSAHLRSVVVYAESEELPVAEVPIPEPVAGAEVELDVAVEGLEEGQPVVVAGLDAATAEAAAEVATIKTVGLRDGRTVLTFEDELERVYDRESVLLNANVARATHGKTVADEVLGSGDGSVPFQRFTLKEKPLTHISAATASGTASTLEVRVDGVRWEEVPTLYEQPATARVYVTRRADDGTVTVQFGDGVHGARLPTGTENVRASYRVGIGLDGLVDAGQISLLMTRPLGVKGAANPTAPSGAADPEVLADARRNAPLTVLTLDRVVSVQDFEDFARAFAGIGKAQATLLWSGERRLVHLTVAGADGGAVPEDSALYEHLRDAIDAARHVDEEVRIASFDPLPFGLAARVLVDAAYVEADVLEAVEAALADAFSFERRAFGQAVTASEVLAAMQAVVGVVAVDLDALGGRDPHAFPRLLARTARWEGGAVRPAELRTLDPAAVALTPMTP